MCSPLCVFVVDVPKKANAFGGKIRRKPNPKGAQASTRVIPNAPPVRFQSVCRAICRRPSWHVWACPSLTEARPSAARCPSVGESSVCSPWRVRVVSAALCFTSTICRLWLPPCEPPRDLPPRTNATRTNTRRTPHRKRPNDDRTQNEQPTNTDAPARQATLSTPPTVNRPWIARLQPVSRPYLARVQSVRSPYYVCVPLVCSPSEARGRAVAPRPPSVDCPYLVRVLSVVCPFAARVNPSRVRDMTFVSPCSGRQRACSHKGSRSLDEIHYAIWRIFTGGIASSSDFMGRKGLSLFRGPRSFQFGTILSLLM